MHASRLQEPTEISDSPQRLECSVGGRESGCVFHQSKASTFLCSAHVDSSAHTKHCPLGTRAKYMGAFYWPLAYSTTLVTVSFTS